jgi:hypothetical protein
MGSSGTFREKSALTVIFWPWAGILMCWYMKCVSLVMDQAVNHRLQGLFTGGSADFF